MARDWHEGREDWRRERGEDDDRRREHRGEGFSAREYDPERRMGPGRGYGQGSGDDWYRDRGDWRDRGGGRTRGSDDPAFRSQFERDFGSREFGTNQRGADSPFSNQRGGYDRGGYGGYLGRGTDEDRWGAPEGMHLSGGGWDEDRGRDRGFGGYGRGEAGYGDRSGRGRSEFGRDYGYGGGMAAGDYRDYGDRGRQGARGGYGGRQDRSWIERAADEVSSWFGGDEREDGHRGRGPKGYRRSDSRIAEDVNDRLSDDHLLDASEIEVKVHNGEVTLTGTVDSRMAKRRAEDIAESVSGVNHCQNNLRITQTGRETGIGQTGIAGTALGAGAGGGAAGTSTSGPQGGQVGSTMSPPSATGTGTGTGAGAGTTGQDPNRPRH